MRLMKSLLRTSNAPAGASMASPEICRPSAVVVTEQPRAAQESLARVGVLLRMGGMGGATDAFTGSGKYVAAGSWTRALTRCGQIPHVDIFASLTDVNASHDQLTDPSPGSQQVSTRFLPEAELPAQIDNYRYDVLHNPMGIEFTRPIYVRSRSRQIFPVTCSQHGISYGYDLQLNLPRMLIARVAPCDAIVCLTKASQWAMEKRLRSIGECYGRAWSRPAPALPRLELIPWGVDSQRFAPRDQSAARRDLQLPASQPIVLCLGRVQIEDKMDWTPLLLAFQHVLRAAKQVPLFVLAGACSSGYGQQLVAQGAQLGLQSHLRTFFNLPPACLPSLYAACDVFVSPTDSPSESFGLTIIEAMACGRPVVASDWNGYKELIVHGETGFRVRTDWADCLGEFDELAPLLPWEQQHLHVGQSVSVDVRQLAGYLTQLVENRQLREEMGRRGRVRVEALYDWPVVMAQWQAMWAELVGVARSLERQDPVDLDYLRPGYFEHFSHYATRLIDDSVPVQITERGKELLAGKGLLWLHPWAQGLLRAETMHAALAALRPAPRVYVTLAVGKLAEVLRKRQNLSWDEAFMHLMGLAKYDLVSFGEGEAAGE